MGPLLFASWAGFIALGLLAFSFYHGTPVFAVTLLVAGVHFGETWLLLAALMLVAVWVIVRMAMRPEETTKNPIANLCINIGLTIAGALAPLAVVLIPALPFFVHYQRQRVDLLPGESAYCC